MYKNSSLIVFSNERFHLIDFCNSHVYLIDFSLAGSTCRREVSGSKLGNSGSKLGIFFSDAKKIPL